MKESSISPVSAIIFKRISLRELKDGAVVDTLSNEIFKRISLRELKVYRGLRKRILRDKTSTYSSYVTLTEMMYILCRKAGGSVAEKKKVFY